MSGLSPMAAGACLPGENAHPYCADAAAETCASEGLCELAMAPSQAGMYADSKPLWCFQMSLDSQLY